MAKKTPNQIVNETRPKAVSLMIKAFEAIGINYNFVGESEIAIQVDTAPTGEPIYAIYSPTMKPYVTRTTASGKVIKAFNLTEAVNEYAEAEAKKAEAEAEAERKKAEKIEKDKARREANETARAEREQLKKGKKEG